MFILFSFNTLTAGCDAFAENQFGQMLPWPLSASIFPRFNLNEMMLSNPMFHLNPKMFSHPPTSTIDLLKSSIIQMVIVISMDISFILFYAGCYGNQCWGSWFCVYRSKSLFAQMPWVIHEESICLLEKSFEEKVHKYLIILFPF